MMAGPEKIGIDLESITTVPENNEIPVVQQGGQAQG